MKSLSKHLDKTYIVPINEKLRPADASIMQMLKFFADNTSGYQQMLYNDKVEDADSVDIVSIYDVFDEKTIEDIKKYVNPQPKCCYENAWKLCDRFEYEHKHDIKYCEGYLNLSGLPIEHAFNCVDGKYVDITVELALNKPISDSYVVIGEYETDDVRKILIENGFYGNIYDTILLKKYKENIKAA